VAFNARLVLPPGRRPYPGGEDVPYQFQLVQKIFESIRKALAKASPQG
jgi:hypothetical protein